MQINKFRRYLRSELSIKMESPAPDLAFFFNSEPARPAFKCSKKVKVSRDADATVIDIIRLDDVITATVEILKRYVLEKGQDGAGKRVMANCGPFQGVDNDVDCV